MEKLRNDEIDRQNGRRESAESEDVHDVGRSSKRVSGLIDYNQLETDAAHYLGVYDIDLIYSWTPRQFKNFIKGAQLNIIDAYELAASSAMFNAKASNSKKRIKLKDVYDADKARKSLENPADEKPAELNLDRFYKARQAMKNYSPGVGGGD